MWLRRLRQTRLRNVVTPRTVMPVTPNSDMLHGYATCLCHVWSCQLRQIRLRHMVTLHMELRHSVTRVTPASLPRHSTASLLRHSHSHASLIASLPRHSTASLPRYSTASLLTSLLAPLHRHSTASLLRHSSRHASRHSLVTPPPHHSSRHTSRHSRIKSLTPTVTHTLTHRHSSRHSTASLPASLSASLHRVSTMVQVQFTSHLCKMCSTLQLDLLCIKESMTASPLTSVTFYTGCLCSNVLNIRSVYLSISAFTRQLYCI